MYRTIWAPVLNERLTTVHEPSNIYDRYAIAAVKNIPGWSGMSVIGHLPKEITRLTRYIMLYGATVTVRVHDVNYQRSPLIQGGLEIPVEVTISMPFGQKNKAALDKYEQLLAEQYKEPENGKYEDVTASVLGEMDSASSDDEAN